MDKVMKIAEKLKVLLPAQDFLVTGSTAAKLMGLGNSNCKDLDLVLVNPDQLTLEVLENLQKSFPIKSESLYSNKNLFRFAYDEVEVDVFITKNPVESFLSFGQNIKVSQLSYIVKEKMKMNRAKDYIQLKNWADQIMSDDKLKQLFSLYS